MDIGRLDASVYPAVQNFCVAARSLGLGTALTTVIRIHTAEVLADLGVPEGRFEIAALVPVGRPAGSVRRGAAQARRRRDPLGHLGRPPLQGRLTRGFRAGSGSPEPRSLWEGARGVRTRPTGVVGARRAGGRATDAAASSGHGRLGRPRREDAARTGAPGSPSSRCRGPSGQSPRPTTSATASTPSAPTANRRAPCRRRVSAHAHTSASAASSTTATAVWNARNHEAAGVSGRPLTGRSRRREPGRRAR